MKIVTGYTGETHISSNDDQGRNQGIFGTGSYVLNVGNKFEATLVDANTVQIQDGEGVIQGVHFRVLPGTVDSVSIENGTNGYNRIDLIVARYTKDAVTGVESVNWAVITGTPTASTPTVPEYNEGDVLAGDTLAEFPIWQVNLNGLTPTLSNPNATAVKSGLVDLIYPIGSIYMSVSPTNPNVLFGGTWEAWGAGRVPVGVNASDSDFATVEKTGGAKTVTLTTAQMPAHTHSALPLAAQRGNVTLVMRANAGLSSGSNAYYEMSNGSNDYSTSSTGGGGAHNNVQPYITCYMWKRIA